MKCFCFHEATLQHIVLFAWPGGGAINPQFFLQQGPIMFEERPRSSLEKGPSLRPRLMNKWPTGLDPASFVGFEEKPTGKPPYGCGSKPCTPGEHQKNGGKWRFIHPKMGSP